MPFGIVAHRLMSPHGGDVFTFRFPRRGVCVRSCCSTTRGTRVPSCLCLAQVPGFIYTPGCKHQFYRAPFHNRVRQLEKKEEETTTSSRRKKPRTSPCYAIRNSGHCLIHCSDCSVVGFRIRQHKRDIAAHHSIRMAICAWSPLAVRLLRALLAEI